MTIEKYSCYEFEIQSGYKTTSPDDNELIYFYRIFGSGCPPYDDGIIESDEWFESEQRARYAAIGHIDLLENGEG